VVWLLTGRVSADVKMPGEAAAVVGETMYDLVANVFHEGASDQSDSDMGFFKAHVLHRVRRHPATWQQSPCIS